MASLSYEGCNFLRQRLVLSTLSGKKVKVRNIRSRDDNPGLRGTVLFYQPGLLYGGSVEHECNVQRSIGYYLEALIMLAPFMKYPLKAVLKGVTNDPTDPSVDLLKATAVPLMKTFGIDGEGLEIKMANRIVDSARSILNKFIPDIYIYTDHMKGVSSGKSPGFGLTLVAETVNGTFLSAEMASTPQGQGDPVLPEELGKNCAKLLLEEVYRGGCVDSTNQSSALLYMTLGQQDVSKLLLGPLSPYTIEFLRHIRDFFQIMFKIEQQKGDEDERKGGDKVLMTCVGAGYTNINKTIR
ncbi:RNA 3'-terminal phosphate cyclase-like protein [Bagarius yarrelli]|uniref:RNA 3'-terminal phosphate cyclase-like protein n=1 Tax=Bagarius yarrelli TaxID=175774 RepID=A0A556TYE3_BAGYA|nr:RNA 3'-terminal phosphate cyclase-like protein [Bagarius yarrelli]